MLADELQQGRPGVRLAGVVASRAPDHLRIDDVDTLIERCDLIVEAASQRAVEQYGELILSRGRELLLLSVGALADDQLAARLTAPGPGRLLLSTGALGGLDLLRAAALSGQLDTVTVRTRKPAAALVGDDAAPEVAKQLAAGEPVTIFRGTARDVARVFPSSTNVAATVGLCTLGLDQVQVEVIADPAAELVAHRVEARGGIGHYVFEIVNHPSANPRTSAVTPYAALRALLDDQSRVVLR